MPREVTRLPDRIVLEFIQLKDLTLDQWRQLPVASVEREAAVLAITRVDVLPSDIDLARGPNGGAERFMPVGTGWWYRGSLGWVGPGHSACLTFDTPTKNMEPGDVWIGATEVITRDALGQDHRDDKAAVVIVRNPDGTIREVIRSKDTGVIR